MVCMISGCVWKKEQQCLFSPHIANERQALQTWWEAPALWGMHLQTPKTCLALQPASLTLLQPPFSSGLSLRCKK